MIELLEKMGLTDIAKVEISENTECYVCNVNSDKVLLIVSLNSLQTIKSITHSIPKLKTIIFNAIENSQNKEFVDEGKLPLSKFLWDLYIIGLHHYSHESEQFAPTDVSQLERDRYAARKIIFEYRDENELEEIFRKIVFPHHELDQYNDELVDEDKTMITQILHNVDKAILFPERIKETITFADLTEFIDTVTAVLKQPEGNQEE